jgi:hypothetical protein
MGLDNTPQHYQDNRAGYAFSHPRDLFDSGVIGVLFGGGNENMTQVWTDGDFIKSQAAIAYAAPAAPTGLTIVSVGTCTVTLRWTPSPDVDVWGYTLAYTRAGGGGTVEVDLRRVSSAFVVIAFAGDYTASVHAYDAMGNEGAASGSVSFTTTQDAYKLFLPVGMKRNP